MFEAQKIYVQALHLTSIGGRLALEKAGNCMGGIWKPWTESVMLTLMVQKELYLNSILIFRWNFYI